MTTSSVIRRNHLLSAALAAALVATLVSFTGRLPPTATASTDPSHSTYGLDPQAGIPLPISSHAGSFESDTVTVEISGGRGGIQTGPYANMTFRETQSGETLTVHLEAVLSTAGEILPPVPIHLYRSLGGALRSGQVVVSFSTPPLQQAEAVAVSRSGTLVWQVEPGSYFLFFPYTRPIVRVPQGVVPSSVFYTVQLE